MKHFMGTLSDLCLYVKTETTWSRANINLQLGTTKGSGFFV